MGAFTDKYKAILKKQAWHKRLMEWHKDSHPLTKNADGTPKVFYHGTGADFDTFDTSMQKNGWLGRSFYFSDNKQQTKEFGKKTMDVFLNLKNPYIAQSEDPTSLLLEVVNKFRGDADLTTDIAEMLKKQSYDGIVYNHWDDEYGTFYSVFNPSQIKSIHNKGTFDENSAVITDSVTFDMAPHRHHIAEKMIGIPQEIEKFGRNFTKFKGKPIEAIEHLIKVKNGQVRGAIYKEGIGDIDFIWGKILNPKKHTGYGLAHIIDKHGVEVARKLPKMINSLPIKNKTSNGVILEDTEQAERVSIQLKYIKKSKIWVLTAYNLDDDSSVVGDTATSMHLIPTLPCNKVGASKFTQIIPKNTNQVNMDSTTNYDRNSFYGNSDWTVYLSNERTKLRQYFHKTGYVIYRNDNLKRDKYYVGGQDEHFDNLKDAKRYVYSSYLAKNNIEKNQKETKGQTERNTDLLQN